MRNSKNSRERMSQKAVDVQALLRHHGQRRNNSKNTNFSDKLLDALVHKEGDERDQAFEQLEKLVDSQLTDEEFFEATNHTRRELIDVLAGVKKFQKIPDYIDLLPR